MTDWQPLAADLSEAMSRTSPTTRSQRRCAMRSSRDVRRTRQRTSRPRARSIRTTTEPMKPLPPVTRIFIKLHKFPLSSVVKVDALRTPAESHPKNLTEFWCCFRTRFDAQDLMRNQTATFACVHRQISDDGGFFDGASDEGKTFHSV